MKIAVVGCGAVGSYYGACLARAGHEVHFLLRSDYEVVQRQGVTIRSPRGDFRVHPFCAQAPEDIGVAELVLIGLKTTANREFGRLLPALTGPGTAIVTLQNGLGNEEQLARLFPAEQILGGLCFVCLNRLEPGVICHFEHGLIVLGEYRRPPTARTQGLAAVFKDAGIPCRVTDSLERAHWEKLVWNIPFNGLGVAGCAGFEAVVHGEERSEGDAVHLADHPHPGPLPEGEGAPATALGKVMDLGTVKPSLATDQLLADARWAGLVRELMLEVIAVARALGWGIDESYADLQIGRTRTMGAYRASTLLDFERGKPLELESLFLEPLRQARQAGVPAPRLAALCAVLEGIEAGRGKKK
jgi:2-dehydropantoate 2-reductase